MAATFRCPICRKIVLFDDPNMPFCSDRCRVIDLGNWATDAYAIPTSESEEDQGESDGSSDRLPTSGERAEELDS